MDETVTKINKIIARMLGKKGNNSSNNVPNNVDNEFINMLIVCLCFLLVWSLTGLYYIEDGYTGIIQNLGSKRKVVDGGSFGFTLPYPFTKIQKVYTNPIEHIPLGEDNQTRSQLVNQKAQKIVFDGDFNYLIKYPLLLSDSLVFNHDKLNNFVRMSIKSELLNYANNEFESKNINFGIISTNIKIKVNQFLNGYGMELLLLNIKDIKWQSLSYTTTNINESSVMDIHDNIRTLNRDVSR
jgi:hypothetical protein